AHTALALPGTRTDVGVVSPHYVRATPSLHGRKAFSYVEFVATGREVHYGRLLLLLDVKRDVHGVEQGSVEVAVVPRLADRGLHELTGCRILGVPQAMGGMEVVAVERIRRAVHCVPSFVTRGRWYLNRWGFRCHESLT
ncbi:unnamed protein product, partial [Closterium sp. NIES-54]